MADPALKIVPPITMAVRRVMLPDLADKNRFLTTRCAERWPHMQPSFIYGWLQQATGMNEYLFVRSNRAFALFQRKRETHDPHPYVEEVFVLAEPSNSPDPDHKRIENEMALAEAADLYVDACRWASSLQASKMEVALFSDVPFDDKKNVDNPNTIKAKLRQYGRTFEERRIMVRFGT